MIKFRIIGATALSLTLAFPPSAMAGEMQRSDVQRSKDQVSPVTSAADDNNTDPNLPVENALRWGYSQGYSNYPTGWGGLYGDGRYPGNVISNYNPRR